MWRQDRFVVLTILLAVLLVVVILAVRATTKSPAQVRRGKTLEGLRRMGTEMVKYAEDNDTEFPRLVSAEPVGYSGAMVDAHEKAKRLKCRNNLKQIGLALFIYREANDGKWPKDLETLVDKRYLTTPKVLQCPSARSPAGSVDYVLVRTKTKKGEPRKFDPADIIVYDRKDNHKDGRNVLLFDQQVLWLSEEAFKKRMGNEPYQ